jgi:hypothetical protein
MLLDNLSILFFIDLVNLANLRNHYFNLSQYITTYILIFLLILYFLNNLFLVLKVSLIIFF